MIGVTIIAAAAVPGSATGANDPSSVELATRLCVEVAKEFGRGRCRFHSEAELDRLVELYGMMSHLQTSG